MQKSDGGTEGELNDNAKIYIARKRKNSHHHRTSILYFRFGLKYWKSGSGVPKERGRMSRRKKEEKKEGEFRILEGYKAHRKYKGKKKRNRGKEARSETIRCSWRKSSENVLFTDSMSHNFSPQTIFIARFCFLFLFFFFSSLELLVFHCATHHLPSSCA